MWLIGRPGCHLSLKSFLCHISVILWYENNKGMVKIAISLPDDVFQEIEKERFITVESRSEFVRRAVQAFSVRSRIKQLSRNTRRDI